MNEKIDQNLINSMIVNEAVNVTDSIADRESLIDDYIIIAGYSEEEAITAVNSVFNYDDML